MVIDRSALIAVLTDEPERRAINEAIEADPKRLLSSATLLECSLVIESRLGDHGGRELDLLVHRAGIQIVAVDVEQTELARDGWRRFGRGRHSAGLNYGDCFSYALAVASGEPLLFKGNDFTKTDVVAVQIAG